MSKLTIGVFCLFSLISVCVGQSLGAIQDGACEDIEAVTDFVASNYVGVWYDIASVESTFQTGKCNTARYSANPTTGGLNIRNSQVDETGLLRTAEGTATASAGAGGSAKFDVVISGAQAVPYWVLATDYTTYALVYSCSPYGTNQRRVNSWKLGRQKGPLPAAATAAIAAKIATTPALQNVEYIDRDHSAAACAFELEGQCSSTLNGDTDFNANEFLGTWYEVARYPTPRQEGQCNRATYSAGAAPGVVNVQNRQVIDEDLRTISGAAVTLANRPGVLQVNFNVGGQLNQQNLVVLDTDNENYALLYSCENTGTNRRRVSSWQLSKQLSGLNTEHTNAINAAIEANADLDLAQYDRTSQSNEACFYYPVWDTLPPTIELPGPCDSSITGFANFDAAAFVGTWYEVARYPQPTQTGQCNRAVYGAGANNVITVQNRQIVDEDLRTITGEATAVTGRPGVLQVTLNTGSGPVTRELYVLDTDHTSYALLYNCETINVDGEQKRRVGSWQMRKQLGQQLTPEATAAINKKIEDTQGLKSEYYQTTSQSDAACFYYPVWETLPSTIELPGPCNTSITGVANFDGERFLGTWYEVARFPQTTQTGQCNRAVYGSGADNAITVQNSQVVDEELRTIPGTATIVDGQSGVLQVTLTTSSGPTQQTLYVLDTDYDNYALLYSCRNIDGNMRQVGSWQMRKNFDPLNAESTISIAEKIEATQGLRQNYYQSTDQSSTACFYYPDVQEGEKVIIPGQCDTSLAGQSNINLASFGNDTWYHIQRYDQVGGRSCIATKLTLEEETDGNFVNVHNIEVIGDVVNRTEGIARLTSAANGQFSLAWSGSDDITPVTIMSTNYNGYAIAYSCENVGTENRQVGVWLLSRTRAWPASGTTAYATLVASRQEFTQRAGYLKPIPHTDECPEPAGSSAFLFKSSIIMIVVCTILQFVW